MADYNVNMKQWNGTGFDNVLPLAYNANQLGGQSLAEVKQWVQDNNLLLYTGQYTGTGTSGSKAPTSVTFPFEVAVFITPQSFVQANRTQFSNSIPLILTNNLTINYKELSYYAEGNYSLSMKISDDKRTISWYSSDKNQQANVSGVTYYYAAIGGYDMGGATEWLITSSGSWVVPRTGRYMLELYGGGGGTSRRSDESGYGGGASCQHYDSVLLTKGTEMSVTVGKGAIRGGSGEATQFGSYSVSGGGGGSETQAGSGAGNYGKTATIQKANVNDRTIGQGKYSEEYGYGAAHLVDRGGSGAVYLKYLGA